MPLSMTTITILRGRNAMLEAENRRLKAILNTPIRTEPIRQPDEPDYSLGGQEWIDPASGADTWNS